MSVGSTAETVQVSDHALNRVCQRTSLNWVSKADIEYRFRVGLRVKVKEKVYHEARLVEIDGSPLVFLRKGEAITTVVYALEEEAVTFQERCPDVECADCGHVTERASRLAACEDCGSTDVRVEAAQP